MFDKSRLKHELHKALSTACGKYSSEMKKEFGVCLQSRTKRCLNILTE